MELRDKLHQTPSEFDGGSFRILHFAPKEGFQITATSYTRKDALTPELRRGIHQGNTEEVAFQNKLNEQAALKGQRREVHPLQSPDFKIKVGISNIRTIGNQLLFDTRPSTFVMYNDEVNVGLTKPENQAMRENLGGVLGVAMIIMTTEPDGTSKMIVQHRKPPPKNRTYGDIIGASAAGLADQALDTGVNRGKLKPIDNDFAKHRVEEEMEEEVGIDPHFITQIDITGIAEDMKKSHYEILLMGKVGLSAAEIQTLSQQKEEVDRKEFDFSEKYFVLDGSPEAIKTLLTQSKNPIPPTHMAAFVAAGRILVAQRDGEEVARQWTKDVEEAARQNTQDIDRIVREATDGQQSGYNPKLTPTEQGLPSVQSEIERLGLI